MLYFNTNIFKVIYSNIIMAILTGNRGKITICCNLQYVLLIRNFYFLITTIT